jgi:hypothetical protein
VKPATTFLNRDFTKENTISSLRQSSSPFFLQEFGPLILLKTKDRFTSLTVIGMTKIMCNSHPESFVKFTFIINEVVVSDDRDPPIFPRHPVEDLRVVSLTFLLYSYLSFEYLEDIARVTEAIISKYKNRCLLKIHMTFHLYIF